MLRAERGSLPRPERGSSARCRLGGSTGSRRGHPGLQRASPLRPTATSFTCMWLCFQSELELEARCAQQSLGVLVHQPQGSPPKWNRAVLEDRSKLTKGPGFPEPETAPAYLREILKRVASARSDTAPTACLLRVVFCVSTLVHPAGERARIWPAARRRHWTRPLGLGLPVTPGSAPKSSVHLLCK